jgi:sugar O-acyltransferase (sialic acid O-acetyltransferase NeuD family)
MKRLGIIGGGDLGIQLAHHASATQEIRAVGFFDDFIKAGTFVSGLPVLGNIGDVQDFHLRGMFDELLIAIGYKHLAIRSQLYEHFNGKIPFAKLIHPNTWIDPTSVIEPGAAVYPGCIVDMYSTVGANSILNVGCIIAHHSIIGPSCFLSPAVKIAGFVRVAASSTLGMGTVVIDNISICSGVRTGAGSVVIDDITEPGLYVGIPAKLKKRD